MIELINVSKTYKKNEKFIEKLNLKINNGEVFGFLGPNGAGKTTTIKMITGILDLDDGDILIDNYSIKKNPIEAKKNFGYLSDNPDTFLELKGIEYLNFLADIYEISEKNRRENIEKFSKVFHIETVLNNKIASYSHGMRQKIKIIGSLIHNPNNWIVDEPMTGLDPESTIEMKKIMREYAKDGKTVFFSTHILDIAEKICDRVGIINNGKLLFVGNINKIKEQIPNKDFLEEQYMEIIKNE